jgi:hypothetical protein
MGSMDTDSEVSFHTLISNVSKGLFSMCTPFHTEGKDAMNHETMLLVV